MVESDQTVLGEQQLRDTNGVASNHLGGNLGWIIARTKNDDLGAKDLGYQTFEIAVC